MILYGCQINDDFFLNPFQDVKNIFLKNKHFEDFLKLMFISIIFLEKSTINIFSFKILVIYLVLGTLFLLKLLISFEIKS